MRARCEERSASLRGVPALVRVETYIDVRERGAYLSDLFELICPESPHAYFEFKRSIPS
jgi:hypothetical protein